MWLTRGIRIIRDQQYIRELEEENVETNASRGQQAAGERFRPIGAGALIGALSVSPYYAARETLRPLTRSCTSDLIPRLVESAGGSRPLVAAGRNGDMLDPELFRCPVG
jgi:hypothetical protein